MRASLSRGRASRPKSSESSPAPLRRRVSIWKNLSWAWIQPVARATSVLEEPVIVGTPSASRATLTGAARPRSA